MLRARIGPFADVAVRGAISRAVIGSVALAIVAVPLAGAIGTGSALHSLAATVVAGGAGILVYVGILAAMRSEELRAIVDLVRRRPSGVADVSP